MATALRIPRRWVTGPVAAKVAHQFHPSGVSVQYTQLDAGVFRSQQIPRHPTQRLHGSCCQSSQVRTKNAHSQLRVSSIQHIIHECANTRTIHCGLVVRQNGCCVHRCSVASALQKSVSVSLSSTPADLPLIPGTWCWVVVVLYWCSQSLEVLIRVSPFASVTPALELYLSRKILD